MKLFLWHFIEDASVFACALLGAAVMLFFAAVVANHSIDRWLRLVEMKRPFIEWFWTVYWPNRPSRNINYFPDIDQHPMETEAIEPRNAGNQVTR